MKLFVLTEREIRIFLNDKTIFMHAIFRPLLLVAIFSIVLENMIGSVEFAGQQIPYLTFVLQGSLLVSIVGTSFVAGSRTVVESLSGMHDELKLSSISWRSICWGRAFAYALFNVIIALIMLPFLILTSVDPTLVGSLMILVVTIIISFGFAPFGIALGSRIKSGAQYGVVANLIEYPLYFLSSVYIPLQAMPIPIRSISIVNPLTYGADAIRYAALGTFTLESVFGFVYLLIFFLIVGYVSTVYYSKHKE